MSDRHFLHLDAIWVKQQLDQLEQPVRDQTQRENRSQEGGVEFNAKLPIGGIEGGGGRKGRSEIESEWKTEDTPERMFDRYHDHLVNHRRLITAPAAPPLTPGERYELRGQIVGSGVFRVEQGFDVTFKLDERYWRHDDDGTDIPLVLFGLCLRGDSVRVMAIYLPEHARPVPPPAQKPVGRRAVLAGLAGAAGLAAGGVAGWQALRPNAPAQTLYRIAGGPGELFADEEVKELFKAAGLTIQHTRFGSGQLQYIDLSKYDGVFPASAIMARYIQGVVGNRAQFPSFGSPMVVMSWEPVVKMLKGLGIAREEHGILVFDVLRYLELVWEKQRWPDPELLGNRRLLLRTTDPSTSNSAAMFIAVASYALNGNNTVTDAQTVAKVLPRIRPCFADQGDMYSTTGFLRRAYFEGPGTVPIGWMYEDDVLDELIAHRRDIKYLYPTPNVLSEHYFIPVNDHPNGAQIGQMLQNHQRLIAIAQERYGNRYGAGTPHFAEMLASKNITVPDNATLNKLVLAEVPSTDILGSFIDALQPQRKSPV